MTVDNISLSISTKECCRPRRGVEPATSWSPVRQRILLRNGMGKSIFYESRQYRGGHAYTISGELVHWTPFRQKLVTANLEAVEGANDRSKYMCFMINRSICEDRMHDLDHRRLMRPPMWHYSYFFFSGTILVGPQIKASKIAEAPL